MEVVASRNSTVDDSPHLVKAPNGLDNGNFDKASSANAASAVNIHDMSNSPEIGSDGQSMHGPALPSAEDTQAPGRLGEDGLEESHASEPPDPNKPRVDKEMSTVNQPTANPDETEALPPSVPLSPDVPDVERDLPHVTAFRGGQSDSEAEDRYISDDERSIGGRSVDSRNRQVRRYADYIENLERRVRMLEMKDDESKRIRNPRFSRDRLPGIPELNYVNWFRFKNHYLDETNTYAIDVLVGPPKYYYQRVQEQKRIKRNLNDESGIRRENTDANLSISRNTEIQREIPDRIRINSMPLLLTLPDIMEQDWGPVEPIVFLRPFKGLIYYEAKIRETLNKLENKWADAERDIPSVQIVNEATKNKEDAESQVDSTDLGFIKTSLDEVPKTDGKDSLEASDLTKPSESPMDDGDGMMSAKVSSVKKLNGNSSNPKKEPSIQERMDSVEALRDFRCLVKFMDEELKPTLDNLKDESCPKILFRDLWHLFKPGDEVYSPLGADNEGGGFPIPLNEEKSEIVLEDQRSRSHERYQNTWRVIQTANGRPILSAGVNAFGDTTIPKVKVNPFFLKCYYIDYDGNRFFPVFHRFSIQYFEGERDVTALNIYPLKYAKESAKLREQLKERGELFKQYTTFKHQYYSGPTFVCHPCGCSYDEAYRIENIESEVVVDFTEAYRSCPDWLPIDDQQHGSNAMREDQREALEAYPVSTWKDRDHNILDHEHEELFLGDSKIQDRMMDEWLSTDLIFKDRPTPFLEKEGELRECDLVLLPSRVFAFVLRNRKFAILDVKNLRQVRAQKEGFKSLKLPGGHKKMVQALVKTHFAEKIATSLETPERYEVDVVRGKGRGLIVLLHGAPGVGKTSTAECVAEANGKPLFPITCGDLGLTAEAVEKELANKFHLAQQWDCVLLLDEADVFLAQRTKSDIKRNSLVSVFLRVLEYYTGILFLTTNRVGAFDEAFKSRIHISLYYPPLEERQTLSIWRMNMDRTVGRKKGKMTVDEEEIMAFALSHYKSNFAKKANWNGRQIRNAFQTATALAEYDTHEENAKRKKDATNADDVVLGLPRLQKQHFEIVAKASLQFDLYIKETTGHSDAERAFGYSERADHFKTSAANQRTEQPAGFRPAALPLGLEQTQASYQQDARQNPNHLIHVQGLHQAPLQSSPITPDVRARQYSDGRFAPQEPAPRYAQQVNSPPWQQQQQQYVPTSETMSFHSDASQTRASANWPQQFPPSPGMTAPVVADRPGYEYDDDDD